MKEGGAKSPPPGRIDEGRFEADEESWIEKLTPSGSDLSCPEISDPNQIQDC